MSTTDPTAVVPAASTPAAPVVPPAAPTEPKVGDPDWLNGRLAQAKTNAAAEERAKVLAELGVTNADEAKTAIAAAKTAADANKSAEQRAAELKTKLDGETAKIAEQSKVIAEIAGRQMMSLTAEQSAAVKAIAGDDAGAQLRAISALQPTWIAPATAAATAAAATTTTAPVVATAPNTAPGHTAPNGATASPPNHRAAYEATQKTNPFAAAEYGLRHSGDVYKPRT